MVEQSPLLAILLVLCLQPVVVAVVVMQLDPNNQVVQAVQEVVLVATVEVLDQEMVLLVVLLELLLQQLAGVIKVVRGVLDMVEVPEVVVLHKLVKPDIMVMVAMD